MWSKCPIVRAIRRRLRMSQQEFSRVYRIPLATLKNWEQGRRQPECSCRSLPPSHRQAALAKLGRRFAG